MLQASGTRACRLQIVNRRLLRGAGIGVGFDFVALLIDETTEFALHGLERVVNDFLKRRVGAVVHSSFIRD